jgi:dipeptidyl-peptidase-3
VSFTVKNGEFAPYLKEINYYLEKAKIYAANDNQREMMELYIKHFQSGSIDDHKDS